MDTWFLNKKIILMDPETAQKSSPKRSFVYLLFSNVEGKRSVPFYAEATTDLNKRFSNHAAVKWHVKTFGRKPFLSVLGTVNLLDAESSVKDLNKILASHQIIFASKPIARGSSQLNRLNPEALQKYFDESKQNLAVSLNSWASRWQVKHRLVARRTDGREPGSSSKTKEENLLLNNPSPAQLSSLVKEQKYRSSAANQVAQKLAVRFDPKTGTSYYKFRYAKNSEKRNMFTLKEARHIVKEISHDWQLVENKELDLRKPLVFKLTVNLKRKNVRIGATK